MVVRVRERGASGDVRSRCQLGHDQESVEDVREGVRAVTGDLERTKGRVWKHRAIRGASSRGAFGDSDTAS